MIHPCRYFLYAQGVPLLIIMITAITDEVGQDWLEENRHSSYSVPIITRSGINKSEGYRGEVFCNTTVFSDQPGENDTLSKYSADSLKIVDTEEVERFLPNMGIFKCFLSNGFLGKGKSYFTQPIFLYMQMYMLMIQIANTFFLISTMWTVNELFKAKKRANQDMKDNELYVRQFKTIGRLFIITGNRRTTILLIIIAIIFDIQGVSWILELISTAVKIEHGSKDELCYFLLVLDLPNLLTVSQCFNVSIEYLNKYSRALSYISIGLLHISCDGGQEAHSAEPEGQGHHLRERVDHDHQVHRVAALRHVLHEGEVTRGHFADPAITVKGGN